MKVKKVIFESTYILIFYKEKLSEKGIKKLNK